MRIFQKDILQFRSFVCQPTTPRDMIRDRRTPRPTCPVVQPLAVFQGMDRGTATPG
jgi:hypothetical protein